jgi:FtsZ-interacting cell division protein ZipA
MNMAVLILFGALALALIIFLVMRNQKDKVKLEDDLNNDFRKSKDEEGDAEIDKVLK